MDSLFLVASYSRGGNEKLWVGALSLFVEAHQEGCLALSVLPALGTVGG